MTTAWPRRGMDQDMESALIAELLSLAASQHQLATVEQAVELGVTPKALRVAVQRGWFRPVRRGVVAVAGAPPSRWEPLMAAAMAAGPDAVVSYSAAACVHRFHGVAFVGGAELTLAPHRRVRLADVRVHRSLPAPKTS